MKQRSQLEKMVFWLEIITLPVATIFTVAMILVGALILSLINSVKHRIAYFGLNKQQKNSLKYLEQVIDAIESSMKIDDCSDCYEYLNGQKHHSNLLSKKSQECKDIGIADWRIRWIN